MLSTIASSYLNGGQIARATGTAHESIVPYQSFPTSDGTIVVGALNDKQFVELCGIIEMVTLAADVRFATNPLRVRHRTALITILDTVLGQRTTEEWLLRFAGSEVPFGQVNNLQQVFADPQVNARDMILNIPFPSPSGSIKTPGFATKLSATPCAVTLPPPLLAQHTDSILRHTLGYDDTKINYLKSAGAFG